MTNPELIALLTAQSALFTDDNRASSAGGVLLTRAELAGYLAGLTHGGTLMAYAKYGQDEHAMRQLIAWVRVIAAGIAIEQHWDIERGKPVLMNLAAIATMEVVSPLVAPHDRCGGTGRIDGVKCRYCGGSGRVRRTLTAQSIYDACGLTRISWYRIWAARYKSIVNAVTALDAELQNGLTAESSAAGKLKSA